MEGGREGGRDGEGREEEKRKRKGKERGRKEEGERERREGQGEIRNRKFGLNSRISVPQVTKLLETNCFSVGSCYQQLLKDPSVEVCTFQFFFKVG